MYNIKTHSAVTNTTAFLFFFLLQVGSFKTAHYTYYSPEYIWSVACPNLGVVHTSPNQGSPAHKAKCTQWDHSERRGGFRKKQHLSHLALDQNMRAFSVFSSKSLTVPSFFFLSLPPYVLSRLSIKEFTLTIFLFGFAKPFSNLSSSASQDVYPVCLGCVCSTHHS